ncbi:unnamed protein product [Lactuca saligna]|uniref:Uncharacterized protein n=1 Tax=Lactuca saligna TaxID=75948 RepID=A0AA35ZW76_LACSI|nr:unnamed protein product [Lactuca saligna]
MAPQMFPFNHFSSQPMGFYHNQSQLTPRPDMDLDPFELVKETQFFSQPQQQTDFQTQPRHLLDESSDSSDEAPVAYLVQAFFQEPEVEQHAQKRKNGGLKVEGGWMMKKGH